MGFGVDMDPDVDTEELYVAIDTLMAIGEDVKLIKLIFYWSR